MLKAELTPTILVDDAKRPAIALAPLRPVGRLRSIALLLRITSFLLRLVWMTKIRRLPPAAVAAHVRIFFEDLGGLWIKAGQILSLRTDLLTREMADELSNLQFRAFGFSPEVSRKIIEDGLGRPLSDVFDEFEELPFAAASIAQVHRAHLRAENVSVVLKVQRPDIAELFQRDLKVIGHLVKLFGSLPAVSYIKWDGMMYELHRIVQEEVDYRYEAENLRRMRKILREHKIHVPQLFRRYSSKHVLVMEFVPGTLMSDYLQVVRADPDRAERWRIENNIDARRVGSRLLRSVYRQMFEDNLFHGDLHPGNIMLLKNSRIALIDLGAVGSLERKFLYLYQEQTKAFAQADFSKAFDYYLMMADSIPVFDISQFKAEAVAVVRAWEARTHMRNLTYYEKSVTGGVGLELGEIARKYKVSLSWQFLRVGRALGTVDASLAVLLGNANPNKIMRKYFSQLRRRAIRRLLSGELFTTLGNSMAEIGQIKTYTADWLRQQSIRFEGVESTASYLLRIGMNAFRIALSVVGVVLFFGFLNRHYPRVAAPIDAHIGAFNSAAKLLPRSLPLEFEVAALLVVAMLFWLAGRVKGHLKIETVRLPNGRLDT